MKQIKKEIETKNFKIVAEIDSDNGKKLDSYLVISSAVTIAGSDLTEFCEKLDNLINEYRI